MCIATSLLDQQIKTLESKSKELIYRVSGYDKELSDFYHKVEVTKFNEEEGFKLAKDLQGILHKRRNVKFQHAQISSLIALHIGSLNKLAKYESNYFKNVGTFPHEEYIQFE